MFFMFQKKIGGLYMKLVEGNKIEVLRDELICRNCLGCSALKDTGFSYLCDRTGEKLEGFNTMEEKVNKDLTNFLPKHMGIGVGFECPLPRVVGKFTEIDLEDEEVELCCCSDVEEECSQCGLCGRDDLPGRCCMNPMKECNSCMEC